MKARRRFNQLLVLGLGLAALTARGRRRGQIPRTWSRVTSPTMAPRLLCGRARIRHPVPLAVDTDVVSRYLVNHPPPPVEHPGPLAVRIRRLGAPNHPAAGVRDEVDLPGTWSGWHAAAWERLQSRLRGSPSCTVGGRRPQRCRASQRSLGRRLRAKAASPIFLAFSQEGVPRSGRDEGDADRRDRCRSRGRRRARRAHPDRDRGRRQSPRRLVAAAAPLPDRSRRGPSRQPPGGPQACRDCRNSARSAICAAAWRSTGSAARTAAHRRICARCATR